MEKTILINEIKEVQNEFKKHGSDSYYMEVTRSFRNTPINHMITLITGKTVEGEEKRVVYKKVSNTEVVKVKEYLFS